MCKLSMWISGSPVGSGLDVFGHYCKLNHQNLNLFPVSVRKLHTNTKHLLLRQATRVPRLHDSRRGEWYLILLDTHSGVQWPMEAEDPIQSNFLRTSPMGTPNGTYTGNDTKTPPQLHMELKPLSEFCKRQQGRSQIKRHPTCLFTGFVNS